jgi:hypothetical protein
VISDDPKKVVQKMGKRAGGGGTKATTPSDALDWRNWKGTPVEQGFEAREYPPAAKAAAAPAAKRGAAAADPKSSGVNLFNYASWQQQMDAWHQKYGNTAGGKAAWAQYQQKYGKNPYLQAYISGTKGGTGSKPANYTAWAEKMNQWMKQHGNTPQGKQALQQWKQQNIGNPYATAYVNTLS